jgi:short-subunit dehydrogenase
MEHAKDGILVTLICPGFVQTDVAKNALTADGSRQEKDDVATRNGIPLAVFARKMVRAIENEKFETYIAGRELIGIYLKRFLPRLLHKVVLRSQVR